MRKAAYRFLVRQRAARMIEEAQTTAIVEELTQKRVAKRKRPSKPKVAP